MPSVEQRLSAASGGRYAAGILSAELRPGDLPSRPVVASGLSDHDKSGIEPEGQPLYRDGDPMDHRHDQAGHLCL